jgi:hypothetical protein
VRRTFEQRLLQKSMRLPRLHDHEIPIRRIKQTSGKRECVYVLLRPARLRAHSDVFLRTVCRQEQSTSNLDLRRSPSDNSSHHSRICIRQQRDRPSPRCLGPSHLAIVRKIISNNTWVSSVRQKKAMCAVFPPSSNKEETRRSRWADSEKHLPRAGVSIFRSSSKRSIPDGQEKSRAKKRMHSAHYSHERRSRQSRFE